MIHISQIHNLVETHEIFSITWVSESGEIINIPAAKCTSFHGKGDTLNILIISSNQVRTINRHTIIEFNSEEVAI